METVSACGGVIKGIEAAINSHDLEALVACFSSDYQSEFPAHPDRAFRGHAQLRANWSQIFHAVPDIHATLLRCAEHAQTAWAEWEWTGMLATGGRFQQRGVTIHGIEHGRTSWVRLYMEPVRAGDPGIASETGSLR